MKHTIETEDRNLFEADCEMRETAGILRHTITKNGIHASCTNEELKRSLKRAFSIDIDAGKVCNQKHSGRCWMFAGLNVLRTILKKNLNVEDIELSQAYLQFYDKLEKSNFFLERALELSDEDISSQRNIFLLDTGIGDGGHFVMFTNLVKKYGVVPIVEMPDLAVSQNTDELNSVLSHYLAQAMMELRDAKKKGALEPVLLRMKEGYLNDIYRILSLSLGKPVQQFTFEYKDKDKKYHALESMTPKAFYEQYIKQDLDQYICLTDAPMEGRKLYQKYTCHLVNNVEGGDPVIFFNVPLASLKKAAIRSLEGGEPIWFGSDVLTQSLRQDGYLASGILERDKLFSVHYHMNKGERLTYRASFCNHAMTFTGVNLVDGKPNRWKVENSWGKENGDDGYYVMSDAWFDDYVYEVFVRRDYVDEDILKMYDSSTLEEESPFNTLWLEMK